MQSWQPGSRDLCTRRWPPLLYHPRWNFLSLLRVSPQTSIQHIQTLLFLSLRLFGLLKRPYHHRLHLSGSLPQCQRVPRPQRLPRLVRHMSLLRHSRNFIPLISRRRRYIDLPPCEALTILPLLNSSRSRIPSASRSLPLSEIIGRCSPSNMLSNVLLAWCRCEWMRIPSLSYEIYHFSTETSLP